MSQWNQEQWGNVPNNAAYRPYPPGPNPGESKPYGQGPYSAGYPPPMGAPPEEYQSLHPAGKDPYAGDRFRPRKRINDWFFLLLFILQVRGDLLGKSIGAKENNSCWALVQSRVSH